jgi:hypothetical protein
MYPAAKPSQKISGEAFIWLQLTDMHTKCQAALMDSVCMCFNELAARRRAPLVYFIQMVGSDSAIKIGYTSKDPEKRVRDLQVGNPFELKLLGTIKGDKETEIRLHFDFRHLNIRGEWFRPGLELVDFIHRSTTAMANIRRTFDPRRIELVQEMLGISERAARAWISENIGIKEFRYD